MHPQSLEKAFAPIRAHRVNDFHFSIRSALDIVIEHTQALIIQAGQGLTGDWVEEHSGIVFDLAQESSGSMHDMEHAALCAWVSQAAAWAMAAVEACETDMDTSTLRRCYRALRSPWSVQLEMACDRAETSRWLATYRGLPITEIECSAVESAEDLVSQAVRLAWDRRQHQEGDDFEASMTVTAWTQDGVEHDVSAYLEHLADREVECILDLGQLMATRAADAAAAVATLPSRGRVVALIGPSGAGKTSILEALLAGDSSLVHSTSWTTRAPREGEVDGVDYHFRSATDFAGLVAEGGFLEHDTVYGRSYGTTRAPIEAALVAGKTVVLVIHVNGYRVMKKIMPEDIIGICISPPSIQELKRRLVERGDEEVSVEHRMAEAQGEWGSASIVADYEVVNRILPDTIGYVRGILEGREVELIAA